MSNCPTCGKPEDKDYTNKLEEFNNRDKKEDLYSSFKFGKHAGKTFEEVYETDLAYLTWSSQNLENKKMVDSITVFLQRKITG